MKINSKKELKFVIMADMMMNRGKFKWNFKDRIRHFFARDYIMEYLKHLRYTDYLSEYKAFTPPQHPYFYYHLLKIYHKLRYRKLGIKLGFSIHYDTIGYGVVIPHYGTIVVGKTNSIGNYAVLHTSICITGNGKVIGDALYCSTGSKLTKKNLTLGDNVSIAANSVVTKSFGSNLLIAGMPAIEKKEMDAWYIRDGAYGKVEKINELKKKLGLEYL